MGGDQRDNLKAHFWTFVTSLKVNVKEIETGLKERFGNVLKKLNIQHFWKNCKDTVNLWKCLGVSFVKFCSQFILTQWLFVEVISQVTSNAYVELILY